MDDRQHDSRLASAVASAQWLGLTIDAAWLDVVVANVEMLFDHAKIVAVADVPIIEPAEVFRA